MTALLWLLILSICATSRSALGTDFLLGFRVGAGLSAVAPLKSSTRSSPALAFISQGEAYARAGRLSDAAAAYERALSGTWALGDDGGAAVGLALGAVYASASDVPRAEASLRAAAGTARDRSLIAAAHGALGSLFARSGRFGDAEKELRVALTLRPGWFAAMHDLGSVLVVRGDIEGGVSTWQDALVTARADKVDFEARAGRERRDRERKASQQLQRTELEYLLVKHVTDVFREPQADSGKSARLGSEGNDGADSTAAEIESQLNSGGAASVEARAASLWALIEELSRIDLASFHAALGTSLFDAGAFDEARAHLGRAADLAPGSIAGPLSLTAALALPLIYADANAVTRTRAELVRNVREALEDRNRAKSPERIKELFPLMFQLPYSGLPSHRIAADIARWLSTADEPPLAIADASLAKSYGVTGGQGFWRAPPRGAIPKTTVRVTLVSFQMFDCATGAALLRITRALKAYKVNHAGSLRGVAAFHVTVARLSRIGDSTTRMLAEAADSVLELYSANGVSTRRSGNADLVGMRALLVKQRPDVLVFADPGIHTVAMALLFARLAPVQVALWGADTGALAPLGLPETIDFTLGPDAATPSDVWTGMSEQVARVGLLDTLGGISALRPLNASALAEAAASHGILASSHLYLVLASPLGVLHPDFDVIICGVLRADAAADVVLLVEAGQDLSFAILRSRLANSCSAAVARRVRISTEPMSTFGASPSAARAALSTLADVVLDTFPVGGGRAAADALAMGTLVVTLPAAQPTRAVAGAIVTALRDDELSDALIARDATHYVALATAIAKDTQKAAKLRRNLAARVSEAAGRDGLAGNATTAEWVTFLGRAGRPWAAAREAASKAERRKKSKEKKAAAEAAAAASAPVAADDF
jgi:tetratricopeptide (TPR) repeat protein